MGDDLAVVNAARVSYGKWSDWLIAPPGQTDGHYQLLKPEDQRLLQFLARGMIARDFEAVAEEIRQAPLPLAFIEPDPGQERIKQEEIVQTLNQWRNTPLHRSPFGQVFLKVHVFAPIHTARQLVKHEGLQWNELSGGHPRYCPDFHDPATLRAAMKDMNQGSKTALTGEVEAQVRRIFDEVMNDADDRYERLIELGLCEEQARTMLPLNTMTEWMWSGSLGAWATMCKLRLGKDTQDEAREVAEEVADIARIYFPGAWSSLMDNGEVIDS